jgi:hypothetical protein
MAIRAELTERRPFPNRHGGKVKEILGSWKGTERTYLAILEDQAMDFQRRTSTQIDTKEAPSPFGVQGLALAFDNTRLSADSNLPRIRTRVEGIAEGHFVAAGFA